MSAGKGDTYRQVDRKKWAENYDRIFNNNQEPLTDVVESTKIEERPRASKKAPPRRRRRR